LNEWALGTLERKKEKKGKLAKIMTGVLVPFEVEVKRPNGTLIGPVY